MWILLTVLATTAHQPEQAAAKDRVEDRRDGGPGLVAVTPSFAIRSYHGGPEAREIARQCHALREQLQIKWFGGVSQEAWSPRCHVILHHARASYVQAVGRGAGQTSGSSLIRFDKGRVAARRIDLLVGRRGGIPALPHELTHIVLAERLGGRLPPLWIDEGIAVLADSEEKQARHLRDCMDAIHRGEALPLAELMTRESFSSPDQMATFYGQSYSLVRFLACRDKPRHLLEFVALAATDGYDQALREIYAIDGVAQLRQLWLRDAQSLPKKTNVPAASVGWER